MKNEQFLSFEKLMNSEKEMFGISPKLMQLLAIIILRGQNMTSIK